MTRLLAAPLLLAIAACGLATPAAGATADPVTRMFTWWNSAFGTPGAYTPEAFRRFFTEDATLTLNGQEAIHGVDQWATHFQKIQAGGGVVEIVVPFKEVFRSGDRVYTYHVIRSRRPNGETGCMLAAGHAITRGGKIASLVLVRHPIAPSDDPACFAPAPDAR